MMTSLLLPLGAEVPPWAFVLVGLALLAGIALLIVAFARRRSEDEPDDLPDGSATEAAPRRAEPAADPAADSTEGPAVEPPADPGEGADVD